MGTLRGDAWRWVVRISLLTVSVPSTSNKTNVDVSFPAILVSLVSDLNSKIQNSMIPVIPARIRTVFASERYRSDSGPLHLKKMKRLQSHIQYNLMVVEELGRNDFDFCPTIQVYHR